MNFYKASMSAIPLMTILLLATTATTTIKIKDLFTMQHVGHNGRLLHSNGILFADAAPTMAATENDSVSSIDSLISEVADAATDADTFYRRKHQRRILRRGAVAGSSTIDATESLLVTGDLPPLSPEQIDVYSYDAHDEHTAERLLVKNKKSTVDTRLFGFGKKGPKHLKKYGLGGLFGGKKFKKHKKKKGHKGGLFNYGGPAAAYGPNAYGAGYNRPGVGLGAILGPIIGIAVVACIVSKLCCLW